ncbi:isochorismatase [Colletotrichum karsti]|uniref:Isochorismatase n=1 Tax=Colletotrichum karsti TaxID=1095194 RepID=A0A9P6IGI8_9PEZI|nr:isochorismatase [Colletotrichum karsti]KAF9882440.1 isochorismatase [Colletotrichum karsti]
MFTFDRNALPQLPTRKGLLVIDFQNDFLSADGALPVQEPNELVSRTLELVKAFRKVGEVIWVCSEFDKPRQSALEKILATDVMPKPTSLASRVRRRGAAAESEIDEGAIADADPEAFLGQPGPPVVRSATPGAQFPAAVKKAIAPRDVTFIKSHYSAFKSGQLLQMLRVKFVTDIFLCGSLTNIGVHATAVDAAKYAYKITLVENCCGFRSDLRQNNAVQSLLDVTGCEVEDSQAVIERLQPKNASASRTSTPASPVVPKRINEPNDGKPPPPAGDTAHPKSIEDQMAALNLDSIGSPSAAKPKLRSSTVDSDCATISDVLEVDPDAQPPQTSPKANDDSPAKEASRSHPENTQTEPALPTEKVSVQPQILEAATDDKNPTPDTEPQSELKATPENTEATMDGKKDTAGSSPQTSEPLCEGDTTVIYNVLPEPLAEGIFEKIKDEVNWQRMSHQGGEVPRLVAVQGDVASDGSMPVYRHPSDESPPLLPFSPTVLEIKAEVEKQLGHPLNHALIQFYRGGTDYISEHSDKTLDIVKGSYIANVSLGAERTMVLRTKRRDKDPSSTETPSGADSKQRKIERAKLPHNSLCRMGLETNMRWLHAIRQDKRMDREKTPAELAFSGGRISLTFRHIGTFLDRDSTMIWGQGATGKSQDQAHPTINGQTPEAVGMLQAFGTENHSTTFDWDHYYGKGFDVLHMNHSPRLCMSVDPVVNMRIALMLAEHGISYAKGSMSPSSEGKDGKTSANGGSAIPESQPVKFIDNDAAKSVVQGDLAIMLYLDGVHGSTKSKSQLELATVFTRFQQGLALLDKWRRLEKDDEGNRDLKPIKKELQAWGGYAEEADFIAGKKASLADFAVWPVLHAIVKECGIESLSLNDKLKEYYEKIRNRDSTARVLGAGKPDDAETA